MKYLNLDACSVWHTTNQLKPEENLWQHWIVPQFLYSSSIFCKTSMRLRKRLKVGFNACARYIYGMSRFRHISPFSKRIDIDTYNIFRMCCTMFKLIKGGCPGYLFDRLKFGQLSRLFNLITPAHKTSSRASGWVSWNFEGLSNWYQSQHKLYLLF
jgi:hypothetical protein